MGIWHFIQRNVLDFFWEIKLYKKYVISSLVLIFSCCVVGIIIYTGATDTVWIGNRQVYIVSIVYSGNFFTVLINFLFQSLLYALALFLFSLHSRLNYLKFAPLLVGGIYLGIYLVAVVELFGLLGFFYFVFVFLLECLFLVAAVILSFCDGETFGIAGRPLFSNLFKCNTRALITLCIGCFVKVLLIFGILRLFSAII